MAVEDHPKYDEWSQALEKLKDANDHYHDGVKKKSGDIEMRKRDLHKAQKNFDQISSEIDGRG